MAKSESENEFDKYVMNNQQNLLAARGATSMYRPIDAPDGEYYAIINRASRSMTTLKEYDTDGKETGKTNKVGRVQLQYILIADANIKTPIAQRELVSGIQGHGKYDLQDQTAWDRCYADLEDIGIRTRNFVPSESMIQNPQVQLTMAQGLDIITRHKPLCVIKIQTSARGNKGVYYQKAVQKQDIEMYLGHPVDINSLVSVVDAQAQKPPAELPVDVGAGMPTGNVVPQHQQQPVGLPGMPGMPQYAAPAMPNVSAMPAAYPAIGAPFGGNPSLLQPQPDGTWFDPVSTHFYSQSGQFVPVTPRLPEPPAQPQMPMGMPQYPTMPNPMVPPFTVNPPATPGYPTMPGYPAPPMPGR